MIGGNMKRTVSYLLFALSLASSAMQLHAQDLAHYKRVVKALSSAKYQGRGYAKGGANKAGKFLQKEYLKAGVDEVTVNLSSSTSTPSAESWRTGCKQRSLSLCQAPRALYLFGKRGG